MISVHNELDHYLPRIPSSDWQFKQRAMVPVEKISHERKSRLNIYEALGLVCPVDLFCVAEI